MKYTSTEFHILFADYADAVRFTQDPYFRAENPLQNSVAPVIAKAPDVDEFLVVFRLYHAPADTDELVKVVWGLAASYRGALDGDDTPATTEQQPPAPEPEPTPAPVTEKVTPW